MVVVWAVCCGVVWSVSGTTVGQEGPKVSIEHRARCQAHCKVQHPDQVELAEGTVNQVGWLLCACAGADGVLGSYRWSDGVWNEWEHKPETGASAKQQANCNHICRDKHPHTHKRAEVKEREKGAALCVCIDDMSRTAGLYALTAEKSVNEGPDAGSSAAQPAYYSGVRGITPTDSAVRRASPAGRASCPQIDTGMLERIEENTKSTSDGVWAMVAIMGGGIALGIMVGLAASN